MSSVRVSSVVILVLLFLLALPAGAHADEVRYSLGTVQEDRELRVVPGGTVTTTVAFYNIDGNVPTMVDVSVVEAPDDWLVMVERPGATGDDSGVVSLIVEPSAPQTVAPVCPGQESESVWLVPRGFVCVDVVRVRIELPAAAGGGTQGTVRIIAVARWQTEVGVAPFPQEREFVFDVREAGSSDAAESYVDVAPKPDGRAPLLLAGGICAGGLVLLRRLLAKSGVLA
jgi:hypothetical protein